jgi:hypothetical protein
VQRAEVGMVSDGSTQVLETLFQYSEELWNSRITAAAFHHDSN